MVLPMDLAARGLDNDTRGWIMCIVSGIACVFGASVICVDSIVRLFPGKRNFRIQESNAFLACSLSLSFGVMLFSALYSMLPEAKEYLAETDLSEQKAGLILMASFVGGFFGIQAISRIVHQFMPSHVVDCDHSHEETPAAENHDHHHHGHDEHEHTPPRSQSKRKSSKRRSSRPPSSRDTLVADEDLQNGDVPPAGETTPLLPNRGRKSRSRTPKRHASVAGAQMVQRRGSPLARSRATTGGPITLGRRQSMLLMQKRVMSFVRDTKCNCDASGPCYGYTDPCGQECFKHINGRPTYSPRQPTFSRTTTGPLYPNSGSVFHGGRQNSQDAVSDRCRSPHNRSSRATSRDPLEIPAEEDEHTEATHNHSHSHPSHSRSSSKSSLKDEDVEAQHHHHVPTNAFLSIGLQTSIAIALHKFPEGFITYATNHANPSLGFNVFMALFVHNITEGFAMALPLYMAIGSRWRAVAWSAVLGGLSQPVGAAVAVIWFKVASRTHVEPDAVGYAVLFACTSGIMVSVALQLFVEALSLNHNRNLCIFFGFLGMAILGFSNALLSH